MDASRIAELALFPSNGGHPEVNSDMMRSRRASALKRPETNSDGEMGIHGAEEFISQPEGGVSMS